MSTYCSSTGTILSADILEEHLACRINRHYLDIAERHSPLSFFSAGEDVKHSSHIQAVDPGSGQLLRTSCGGPWNQYTGDISNIKGRTAVRRSKGVNNRIIGSNLFYPLGPLLLVYLIWHPPSRV